jgi:hypothetical protein
MVGAKKAQIANSDIYPQKKSRKKCATNLTLQMMMTKEKYAVIKIIAQVAKFVQKYTMTTIT